MYAWLWRKLPGPWPVKTLQSLVLLLGTCVLLFLVVFPWVEPKLPFSDNVVDGSVPASTAEPVDAGTGEPAGDAGDDDEKPKKKKKKKKNDDDGGDQLTLPGEG